MGHLTPQIHPWATKVTRSTRRSCSRLRGRPAPLRWVVGRGSRWRGSSWLRNILRPLISNSCLHASSRFTGSMSSRLAHGKSCRKVTASLFSSPETIVLKITMDQVSNKNRTMVATTSSPAQACKVRHPGPVVPLKSVVLPIKEGVAVRIQRDRGRLMCLRVAVRRNHIWRTPHQSRKFFLKTNRSHSWNHFPWK